MDKIVYKIRFDFSFKFKNISMIKIKSAQIRGIIKNPAPFKKLLIKKLRINQNKIGAINKLVVFSSVAVRL